MKTQRYRINDTEYDVAVTSCSGGHAEVIVNGIPYNVDILRESDAAIGTAQHPDEPPVRTVMPTGQTSVSESHKEGERIIASPLPGVILGVKVNVGDRVKAGQVIAILEAMKMENEIQSEYDGIVSSVHVSQGDSILEGETIVTII